MQEQEQVGPGRSSAQCRPEADAAVGVPPPPPGRGGTFGLVRELWLFAGENKKWWLLPMLLVLVLLGVILFMTAGSAIAPFIYTIF